jgi:hypothetical protein
VLGVGHLEPGEFGAILPRPLAHVVLPVHLDVGEGHPVILVECHTVLISVLLEDGHLQLHVVLGDACEDVA